MDRYHAGFSSDWTVHIAALPINNLARKDGGPACELSSLPHVDLHSDAPARHPD
jgi:hypothetical protein